MAIEKIENIADPVVGRYYDVPCAVMQSKDDTERTYIYPILDHYHADPQFGFNKKHWHFDTRFIKHSQKSMHVFFSGKTNSVLTKDMSCMSFVRIERRRRKCVREVTGVQVLTPPSREKENHSYWKFYRKNLHKTIENRKCPHYGATMYEHDGRLKCPLHSLEGCPKNLKIIPPAGMEELLNNN